MGSKLNAQVISSGVTTMPPAKRPSVLFCLVRVAIYEDEMPLQTLDGRGLSVSDVTKFTSPDAPTLIVATSHLLLKASCEDMVIGYGQVGMEGRIWCEKNPQGVP